MNDQIHKVENTYNPSVQRKQKVNEIQIKEIHEELKKSKKPKRTDENSSDDSDDEWTFSPPQYYNVKTTSVQALESYKYTTMYKHNKKSGRTVRYFLCQYEN
mmetsp:Transcript_20044/g.17730  ORF Transcript_20044/g.17730 Transcript_20044/m.17730 type:complete len:102 (-) Transcript_20044:157-462(-)|eukprot:CAMPEP_0205802656 /NCGR_PEP_ID=MMETSP0205-20121125/5064_1 /ASSEMBLY_ACC=CAM_ASM_000278 /TAXON_ID=36767 /ORGANISM="Euplotes focardii, Strain TN1" /LENGTH=101 /DNA_ID=CAMNT_0053069461 /DNA_START=117 /DNA_END=422 /DNA_ORIENTATION=+